MVTALFAAPPVGDGEPEEDEPDDEVRLVSVPEDVDEVLCHMMTRQYMQDNRASSRESSNGNEKST
jgi:hypothetical protein